jgi:hypothetical protein
LRTGAGVGVAGIDDDGLGSGFLYAGNADFDRRGADLAGGKQTGHGRGHFGKNDGEVAFLAFVRAFTGAEALDVAENAGGEKALWDGDGAGDLLMLHR